MIVPPLPSGDTASAPFWEATRAQRLVVQRCAACAAHVWYPRAVCPACLSDDLAWIEVGAVGRVYSVSVHYRAPSAELAGVVPYAVALVDLDEGPRLLSNVVHCDPEAIAIGDRVRGVWAPLPDGRHLLRFEPDPDRAPDQAPPAGPGPG
jgi:uncharacterized OB-fold protein